MITLEEKRKLVKWMGWSNEEGSPLIYQCNPKGEILWSKNINDWRPENGGNHLAQVLANLKESETVKLEKLTSFIQLNQIPFAIVRGVLKVI